MKGLKNFDFFQKISVDNVTQPTIVGSLISLTAISMIIFLILRETLSYITPSIKKDTIIYQDPNQKDKIHVNFGIKFPHLTCELVSVDQEDSVGNHRMDIHDTLRKIKIDATGTPLPGQENQIQNGRFIDPERAFKSIEQNEGCWVEGHVPISKVPGDIHVSFHGHADLFMLIRTVRQDLNAKIAMNHRFTKLNFGDADLTDDVFGRFGFDEHNAFNSVDNMPNFGNVLASKSYDYYIKLIPHLFVDNIRGRTYHAYQYSLTARSKDYNPATDGMPIVMVHYDMSPLTMRLTLNSKSLSHTLTHICAIVGGVFVIFSILNRLILTFFDFSSKSSNVADSR